MYSQLERRRAVVGRHGGAPCGYHVFGVTTKGERGSYTEGAAKKIDRA